MKIGTSMGLMVLVAALLMGTGMAANTVITATNQPAVSMTAPESFSDWTFDTIGENNKDKTISITSNDACKIQVKEATGGGGSGADGKMYSSSKTHNMGAQLVVDATDDAGNTDGTPSGTVYYSVTLSDTDQDLFTCSQAVDLETSPMNIDFEQTTAYNDPAAADYTITVTFTASNT